MVRWLLIWSAVLVLVFGCATAPGSGGWHPKSRQEMHQVIMESIDAYRRWMEQQIQKGRERRDDELRHKV